MALASRASEGRVKAGLWAAALFVMAVFALLWGLAVLRLHRHLNGEIFLGRHGWTDSLLTLLAPAAIFARYVQLRRDLRARG